MNDFRLLGQASLAELICAHAAEFDDRQTLATLSVSYLLDEVAHGRAVIEADEHAVAVVRPEGWRARKGNAILWLIFVDPEWRCAGNGSDLVMRMKVTHARKLAMHLLCHGGGRMKFFERCGFHVKQVIPAGIVMMAPCRG